MKKYKALGEWNFKELEIEEINTKNKYTLTQPKGLISEDYYGVYRTIAIPHQEYETESYIYQISYMIASNGSCLVVRLIDEETMKDIIEKHSLDILHGTMDFEEYFNNFKD